MSFSAKLEVAGLGKKNFESQVETLPQVVFMAQYLIIKLELKHRFYITYFCYIVLRSKV